MDAKIFFSFGYNSDQSVRKWRRSKFSTHTSTLGGHFLFGRPKSPMAPICWSFIDVFCWFFGVLSWFITLTNPLLNSCITSCISFLVKFPSMHDWCQSTSLKRMPLKRWSGRTCGMHWSVLPLYWQILSIWDALHKSFHWLETFGPFRDEAALVNTIPLLARLVNQPLTDFSMWKKTISSQEKLFWRQVQIRWRFDRQLSCLWRPSTQSEHTLDESGITSASVRLSKAHPWIRRVALKSLLLSVWCSHQQRLCREK